MSNAAELANATRLVATDIARTNIDVHSIAAEAWSSEGLVIKIHARTPADVGALALAFGMTPNDRKHFPDEAGLVGYRKSMTALGFAVDIFGPAEPRELAS